MHTRIGNGNNSSMLAEDQLISLSSSRHFWSTGFLLLVYAGQDTISTSAGIVWCLYRILQRETISTSVGIRAGCCRQPAAIVRRERDEPQENKHAKDQGRTVVVYSTLVKSHKMNQSNGIIKYRSSFQLPWSAICSDNSSGRARLQCGCRLQPSNLGGRWPAADGWIHVASVARGVILSFSNADGQFCPRK